MVNSLQFIIIKIANAKRNVKKEKIVLRGIAFPKYFGAESKSVAICLTI